MDGINILSPININVPNGGFFNIDDNMNKKNLHNIFKIPITTKTGK